MSKLERELVINPAWDKRHSDPKKNYGVHGVEMRWYVKGEKGVVQFVLYTNWHLPHVARKFENDPKARMLMKPFPADIGHHSPVPRYEGQYKTDGECSLLHGDCYYDGSGLRADKFFDILVAEGGDKLWESLETEYQEVFEG